MKHKLQAAATLLILFVITFWTYQSRRELEKLERLGQQAMLQQETGEAAEVPVADDGTDEMYSETGEEAGNDTEQADGQAEALRRVSNLRVNYVENPVGIDTQNIKFSWETESFVQQAYQILVEDEKGDCVWDSGVVPEDDTIQIAYEGEPLSDLTRYSYRVLSYDGDNCYISPQAYFETAYVQGEPFADADFIAMQGEENVYGDGQPVFYKTFQTGGAAPEKAYFFGSALGIYDVWINGKRVGEDEFKPGWTDYNDTLLYNMYDVTDYIRESGEKHSAIMLGTGWWCGRNGFGTYGFHQPAVIGELQLTFEDGSTQKICTDATWHYCKDTQIQFADFFNGETADLRKPGAAEFSQGKAEGVLQKDVVISEYFTGEFRSFYGYRNKRREELTRHMQAGYLYEETADNGSTYGEVIRLSEWEKEPEGGIFVLAGQTLIVDLGQNIAGVPEFTIATDRENEITVQFAEMLNDSGQEEKGNDGPAGSLYRENYRSAATTVTVCTGATERTVYSPSFFFTGFRYLSLTAAENVTVSDIKGICIGNDSPETGTFVCDNEKLNRLYENVFWSQRNNYTLIATDCPQRDERLGWTGDLQSFSTTSLYNQDLFSFYQKWNRDLLDAQTGEGAYTDTVPATVITGSGNGGWAEAGIMVPLHVYDKYGDKEVLSGVYPSMKRYMEYLSGISSFVPEDRRMGPLTLYGDWLAAEDTDSNFLSALWYAADASCMSSIAKILGEKADQKAYEELFAQLKDYIGRTYLQEGITEELSQTELCFLLRYGLLTETQKEQAVRKLVASVEKNAYKLVTGYAGTPILLHTLTEQGETSLAYRLLLSEENPSWLYSVNQGATTIWERFDSYTVENGFSDSAMNSFDHFNQGSVTQWIYEDLLWITVALSEEETVRIAPKLPDEGVDLHEAEGSYHSVFGKIAVSWSISQAQSAAEENTVGRTKNASGGALDDGIPGDKELSGSRRVSFKIRIPSGVTAHVSLPVEGCEDMLLDGGLWNFEGILLEE